MTNLENDSSVASNHKAERDSNGINCSTFILISVVLAVVVLLGTLAFRSESTYLFKLDNGDGTSQVTESDKTTISDTDAANIWLRHQLGCRYTDAPADYTQRLRKTSGTIDRIFDHKTVVTYKASESVTSTLYFTVKEVPDRIFSMSEDRLCEGTFYSGSIGAPVYAFGLAQPGDKVDLYYIDDDLNGRRPNPDHIRYLLGFDDATTGIKGYAPWYVRKLATMKSEQDPAPAK